MAARRFPLPWTIDEMNNACFIVRDKNGQQLGYFYYEQEPSRRMAANLLTKVSLLAQTRGSYLGLVRECPTQT